MTRARLHRRLLMQGTSPLGLFGADHGYWRRHTMAKMVRR